MLFQHAMKGRPRPALTKILAFFLAYPGLDARSFFFGEQPAKPQAAEWALAAMKTMLGATLAFGVARLVPATEPLAAGWVFMTGLIFALHFGLFHLLALAWRSRGVNAPLMMLNPARATSVAEFWGKRWNRDFRVFVHELIFKPLSRTGGIALATCIVFLFSGVVHDLVISVPARAGFGLPTIYFLLQALGLWFERTTAARRLGLARGLPGWSFTLLVTLGPALWLFHPAFVVDVMLPFAHAIGAM
jgi:alginate O-acetyltransferase complex protein AlgI